MTVRTKLRKVWSDMRERCYNPNAVRFPKYGARGIGICDRWQDFEAFFDDMRDTYSLGLSLDRIDNDKDYGPDNCRWTDAKEQSRNRSNAVIIEYEGEQHRLADLAEKHGIDPMVLRNRIFEYNWSVTRALVTPVPSRGKRRRKPPVSRKKKEKS